MDIKRVEDATRMQQRWNIIMEDPDENPFGHQTPSIMEQLVNGLIYYFIASL